MSEDIEALLQLGKIRRYSAFFEEKPKERKEAVVGEELSRSLQARFGIDLNGLLPGKDPPDLVATVGGQIIAIEATELVCFEAVMANQKAERSDDYVYRHWNQGEVMAALIEMLKTKDTRILKGGPFSEYWVCIHTDEFELSPERVQKDIADDDLGQYAQINRVFLLFSHRPGQETYPLLELPINGVHAKS